MTAEDKYASSGNLEALASRTHNVPFYQKAILFAAAGFASLFGAQALAGEASNPGDEEFLKKLQEYEQEAKKQQQDKKDQEFIDFIEKFNAKYSAKKDDKPEFRALEVRAKVPVVEAKLNEAEAAEIRAFDAYNLGNLTKLEKLYKEQLEKDPDNKKYGVNDNLAFLVMAGYSMQGDRDKVIEKGKEFMKKYENSELFNDVADIVDNDPLVFAGKARTKHRLNSIFKWFNALQDVAILGVVSGTEDMFVNAAVALGMNVYEIYKESKYITNNERQAMNSFLDFANKYPNHPKLNEVKKKLEPLLKKDNETLAREEYDWAEQLVEKAEKDPSMGKTYRDSASFHYRIILDKFKDSSYAKKSSKRLEELVKISESKQKEAAESLKTEIGEEEKAMNGEEWKRYNELNLALTSARTEEDGRNLLQMIERYEKEFPNTKAKPNLAYARAIAYDTIGEEDKAEEFLEKIVSAKNKFSDDAADMLNSRRYFMLRAIEAVKSERKKEILLYLLFGMKHEEGAKKTAVYIAAGAYKGISGVKNNAIGYLGIGAFMRWLNYLRDSNVISQEECIDMLSEYVRLGGPKSKKFALEAGKRLHDQNNYSDADKAYRKSLQFSSGKKTEEDEEAEKLIKKNNEGWADEIVKRGNKAAEEGKSALAEFYFKTASEKFPGSKQEADALIGLADLYHRHEEFKKEKAILDDILKKHPGNKRIKKEVEERLKRANN